MIIASKTILSSKVLNACASSGVQVYVLNRSKANTLAFGTNNRRRREFEIVFLANSTYRISTRFLEYKRIFDNNRLSCKTDNDPDGRRKRFIVETDNVLLLNDLILSMVKDGLVESPTTQRI